MSFLALFRYCVSLTCYAFQYTAMPAGIIRGALSRMGFVGTVVPEITSMPQCKAVSIYVYLLLTSFVIQVHFRLNFQRERSTPACLSFSIRLFFFFSFTMPKRVIILRNPIHITLAANTAPEYQCSITETPRIRCNSSTKTHKKSRTLCNTAFPTHTKKKKT